MSKRKPLNAAMDDFDPAKAEAFMKGSQPEPESTPTPKTAPKKTSPKKSSAMSKLLDASEKEATTRITVDLPQSLHKRLTLFCAENGVSKADIIRALLSDSLPQ